MSEPSPPTTNVSRSDLEALLSRVGEATGPNFELEQLIHDTLFPPNVLGFFPDGQPIPKGWGGNFGPAYTASLDAALALCERRGRSAKLALLGAIASMEEAFDLKRLPLAVLAMLLRWEIHGDV